MQGGGSVKRQGGEVVVEDGDKEAARADVIYSNVAPGPRQVCGRHRELWGSAVRAYCLHAEELAPPPRPRLWLGLGIPSRALG